METVLKAIADWIKGILTAGIMSNLSGLFDDVNTQVGNIAQQVGTKPSSFEPRVFAMIEALSRNVVLPIAGIILTFIACYELIEMITQHNNMAQFEPALIMRWIFKTAVSVWFISNTFDIVMAVFDITQKVVSDSSGIIAGNTHVNDIGLSMLQSSLMQMDVGPLFGLFLQSFFIGITMRILSIVIFVIVYGRMIEIYCIPVNDKYSTTEGKTSEKLSDEAMLSAQWKNIDWHKAEQEVNRLQIRIVKATQQKDYNAVKRLQYLLTHSFYAKALAVKRVVTNDGRKTPGVDGVLWNTPAKKMKAVLSLTDKGYRARPLRRVYIEKKDKKKKRPLGIPTMYDRAMQALYALALEPVAETTADGKSFGFRKGRCAQDACEYLFNALSRKHISPKWVLEGDIKGCFDHISHDWLLANIPMDKNILKQFLKAGFIYQRELFPTEEGTPQGGIISPILANMTLDGIEKKLVERFHTNALGKVDSRFKNAHKVNFVRYADDFVVTAATPELALEAKELIREFLAERGLELSDEKTVVTNIDDGFDFLGWNFRKYNEKLIIKPSQKAVKAIVSNISDTILRRGKAWQQDVLIMKLNEQIRGWTNYHQSVCASDAFAHLDYVLYELLWRWAKRRHPKKNKWWISTRYWHRVGNRNWVFSTENKELIRVDSTAIVRHTKIKATANPFLDEAYFQKRKFDKGMHRLTGKFKMIWKNQNGLCYHCGMPMDVTEEREIFYLAPKAKAGMEDVRNMRYVHCTCQRIYAENRLKK